jgi:RNA polymerase sigma factor (sigma-70 family)
VDETGEQVVDRSMAGDPAAFVELFRLHGPAVHGYLARRAGRQDADDLLSEVWLRAFKGRTGRRGPNALPWLYGIASNVLFAHWRQNMRPPIPVETPDSLDPWPDADTRMDAIAQQGSIRRVLAMLPEDEREVLLLVVWEQLTPAEVALVLGLPQGTARSRLHRALSTFRSEFNSSILICSNPKEA